MTKEKIFTVEKAVKFIIGELIGRFISFAVAIWFSKFFTHVTVEKKSIKNLFGLAKRKKVVVREMPEWVEVLTIAIIGFIIMELINYLLDLPVVKSKINVFAEKAASLFRKKQVPVSE
jgi:hypothetical protein